MTQSKKSKPDDDEPQDGNPEIAEKLADMGLMPDTKDTDMNDTTEKPRRPLLLYIVVVVFLLAGYMIYNQGDKTNSSAGNASKTTASVPAGGYNGMPPGAMGMPVGYPGYDAGGRNYANGMPSRYQGQSKESAQHMMQQQRYGTPRGDTATRNEPQAKPGLQQRPFADEAYRRAPVAPAWRQPPPVYAYPPQYPAAYGYGAPLPPPGYYGYYPAPYTPYWQP